MEKEERSMEEGGAQDGRRGKRSVGGPSGFEAEGIGRALYTNLMLKKHVLLWQHHTSHE